MTAAFIQAISECQKDMEGSAENMLPGLDPSGDAARVFRICSNMLRKIIDEHCPSIIGDVVSVDDECDGRFIVKIRLKHTMAERFKKADPKVVFLQV